MAGAFLSDGEAMTESIGASMTHHRLLSKYLKTAWVLPSPRMVHGRFAPRNIAKVTRLSFC